MIGDTLRPPALFDPTADAYKDWLHLNVFDHASGCIGIFNASLHGSPLDSRSRAIGAAIVHVPDKGWVGNVEGAGMDDANIGTTSIALERVALATDPAAETVLASVRFADDGLNAGITASAQSRPVDIAYPLPFGPGWISWFVLPRLSVTGGLVIGADRLALSRASAYHDHNWGRWHWGDDIGWEWGACHAEEPITVVVSRATNRSHSNGSDTVVIADVRGERRIFSGQLVSITYEGRFEKPLRRLPGALAALHHHRIAPRLPALTRVRASDGVDNVDLEFRPRAAAQLIAGDPVRRGYSFIQEMVGSFEAECRIAGQAISTSGLAVFEYVD